MLPIPRSWARGWRITSGNATGLTTAMSYWSFSDVFEEQGVVKRPFYGGYGLIAEDDIPKAAFNAFRLLHMLGEERIPVKFFFQAEDGIRDYKVTGVQTCALPI